MVCYIVGISESAFFGKDQTWCLLKGGHKYEGRAMCHVTRLPKKQSWYVAHEHVERMSCSSWICVCFLCVYSTLYNHSYRLSIHYQKKNSPLIRRAVSNCLVIFFGDSGNRGHLPYLMASCTSFAVCPFLLLINSNPEALLLTQQKSKGRFRKQGLKHGVPIDIP